jgi:hypothetical protein
MKRSSFRNLTGRFAPCDSEHRYWRALCPD